MRSNNEHSYSHLTDQREQSQVTEHIPSMNRYSIKKSIAKFTEYTTTTPKTIDFTYRYWATLGVILSDAYVHRGMHLRKKAKKRLHDRQAFAVSLDGGCGGMPVMPQWNGNGMLSKGVFPGCLS